MALSIYLLTLICLYFYFQRSLCDATPNFREIFLNKLYRNTYLKPSSSALEKERCKRIDYRELFLSQQYQRTFIEHNSGSKGLRASDCTVQCQNGGICSESICQCPVGYSGQFCQNLGITYLVFYLETSNKNASVFYEMTNLTYSVWQRLLLNNANISFIGRLAELRKNDVGNFEPNITSSDQMRTALSKFNNYENLPIAANITAAFTDSFNYLMEVTGSDLPGAVVLLSDGIPENRFSSRNAAKYLTDQNFALFVVLCNGNNTEGLKYAHDWTVSSNIFALNNQSIDELIGKLSENIADYSNTFNGTVLASTTQGNVSLSTSATFLPTTPTEIPPTTSTIAIPVSTTTTTTPPPPPRTTDISTNGITTTTTLSETQTISLTENNTAMTSNTITTTTSSGPQNASTTENNTAITSNTTASTSTTIAFDGNSGLPTIAVIGIIIGSILIIALFLFILFYCRYRARHEQRIAKLAYSSNSSIVRPKSSLNSYVRSTKSKEILNPNYLDVWHLEPNRLLIEKDQVLGSGAFAMVYRGRILGKAPVSRVNPSVLASKQFIDCEVAVKIPPIYADQTAISDFRQEMNLMKIFGYHNHLISLLGSSTTQDGNPCMITELCSGGNLLYYVRSRKENILKAQSQAYQNSLRFRDLLSFAWQICDGMDFLGSKGCIHRDLAARNVLVNAEKTAKVGDFGLCRLMNSAIYTARGGRLPIKWMSIESLQIYEYSFKSDVWSFGVVLYELFSLGNQPYTTVQPADMIEHLVAGHRLEKPDSCPDEIYQIMTSTWVAEPEKRPTFDKLRSIFAKILENATQDYGYLQMSNEILQVADLILTGESDN